MLWRLCKVPATFQRLMRVVLGYLTFDVLFVYLDDMLVFSKDFDSHFERLDLVFGHVRDHDLKLKPRKCFLFKAPVRILGHVASPQGIQVNMEKVKVLGNLPVPRNVKEFQQRVRCILLTSVWATFCTLHMHSWEAVTTVL